MAGTSDIYTSQISQLQDDLQKWQVFIDQISSVIETFDESMTTMQTQIDSMQTTLNSLLIRTDIIEASIGDLNPYVKTSTSAVIINGASLSKVAKLDIYTNKTTIYAYADKTPDYVVFNNAAIKSKGEDSAYFTSFEGSKDGVQKTIQITSNDVTPSVFSLWFSYSPTFNELEATKVSVTIQKNYDAKNYLLSDNKVSTSIQTAIDSGINAAESSNKVYINSTLSAFKEFGAIQSAAAVANRPTSITNIMTASNISASAIKTASTTSTTSTTTASEANIANSVIRSSGSSKSLKSTTKSTTSKKLR